MSLAKEAYVELFGREPAYTFSVAYSGRFSAYNAKVIMGHGQIRFSLSRSWKPVDDMIQKGLMQHLLVRLFKSKKKTDAMELYHRFIKTLDKYDEGSSVDAQLRDSFTRVNDRLFDGLLSMPHLRWGKASTRLLGHYNFHTNTLTLSTILVQREDLLDYVMYHELLHKDMKYEHKGSGQRYHTTEFRRRERAFAKEDYEKKLEEFLLQRRKKHSFFGFLN